MPQQLQTFSITAPGFNGLNSQDSSLDLSTGWALVANNCVIDQYGRIGPRGKQAFSEKAPAGGQAAAA